MSARAAGRDGGKRKHTMRQALAAEKRRKQQATAAPAAATAPGKPGKKAAKRPDAPKVYVDSPFAPAVCPVLPEAARVVVLAELQAAIHQALDQASAESRKRRRIEGVDTTAAKSSSTPAEAETPAAGARRERPVRRVKILGQAGFVCGINAVTRGLEKQALAGVILPLDPGVKVLTAHLPQLCCTSRTPVCAIAGLVDELKATLQVQRVGAIGWARPATAAGEATAAVACSGGPWAKLSALVAKQPQPRVGWLPANPHGGGSAIPQYRGRSVKTRTGSSKRTEAQSKLKGANKDRKKDGGTGRRSAKGKEPAAAGAAAGEPAMDVDDG